MTRARLCGCGKVDLAIIKGTVFIDADGMNHEKKGCGDPCEHCGITYHATHGIKCPHYREPPKTAHSPEPWRAEGDEIYAATGEMGVRPHVSESFEMSEADVRRVIVCVNACAGIRNFPAT